VRPLNLGFILRLFWRLTVLVLLYQGMRALFLAANLGYFAGDESFAIAFLHGARFDISAIVTLNSLYLILILLGLEANYPRFLRWLYVLPNSIFVFANLGDALYFPFSAARLSVGSFAISQDIFNQAPQLLFHYWYLGAGTLVTGFFLYVAHGTSNLFPFTEFNRKITIFIAHTSIFILLIVAVRGGLQAKPLAVGHAYLYGTPKHVTLTLNSTFTLFKSKRSEKLTRHHFFSDWTQLGLSNSQIDERTPQYDLKTNIVIIILESFGREYMGYKQPWLGYTPFLDSLAEQSSFIEPAFVNGRRSIDAVPSILAAIPALMTPPLATSEYQTRDLVGLPTMVRSHGYHTAFFHGGHDGTMFFDILATRLGFTDYYGANAYPDQSHDDGRWGIYDEPFLQWTVQKLSEMKSPFFATIFTLTSHHPYKIPESYLKKFPEGNLPIHRSIRYADYALERFFAEARKQTWFDNTLFIITADHTSTSEYKGFQANIGLFRAPILFYHPSNPVQLQAPIAQHIDIIPTLSDLLGLKTPPHARFGNSLVNSKPDKSVILFSQPYYWLVRDPYLLQATTELTTFEVYNWREDPSLSTPIDQFDSEKSEEWVLELKRKIQYYNNGLIENKLNW